MHLTILHLNDMYTYTYYIHTPYIYIGLYTFQLVTTNNILHMKAQSSISMSSWIEAIREAISRSYLGERFTHLYMYAYIYIFVCEY